MSAPQFIRYPAAPSATGNASVSANGSPIPPDSTLVGGENPSGNLQPLQTDAAGALIVVLEGTPTIPLNVNVADWGGSATTLGQKLSNASVPVVLASDDIVPISAMSLPLPTGASTSALQTSGNNLLASILLDQTNGSQLSAISNVGGTVVAAVKPASTAAIATDPALVVAISPNNIIPVAPSSGVPDIKPATQNITVQDTGSTTTAQANGQSVITGTPTAGSTALFTVSSVESLEIQSTGTWTGTLSCEVSFDGGTTWFTRGLKQAGSSYFASSFTQNFEGGCNAAAITNHRVRATSAMTGTATIRVTESVNTASIIVSNPLTLRDFSVQSIQNTIKAASTLPLATDTALVVTNRDPVTVTPAVAATPQAISITGTNAAQTYDVRQYSVVGVVLTAVGSSNIIAFEGTVDGSSWFPILGFPADTGVATVQPQTTGTWTVNVAGYQTFRVIILAGGSGTVTGTIFGVPGTGLYTSIGQNPAQVSQGVTLSNENVQDLYMIGVPAQTATIQNILTNPSGSAATDLTGYRYGSVQVVSTGTGGTFIFEGSNDNSNFQTILAANQSLITGSINAVAITASSSSNVYHFPVTTRYVRLRIATTITGGSIQAFSKFSQNPWSPLSISVAQNTAADLAMTATIAANQIISVPVPAQSTDVASAAITTTTTTATIVPGFGNAYNSTIDVTVVAGTNPTMDVVIQESSDLGTNWYNVYEFPLITATGSYTSPVLSLTGNRLRYVQTITGSAGQSFTRSVTRNQITGNSNTYREIVDRTINPTSTNSTTPVLQTNGASNLQMIVNQGAGGSAVTFALDGSDDNINWVSSIATVIGVVGGATPVSVTGPNISYKFIRGRVVLGVAATTISYLTLIASGIAAMPTNQMVAASQGTVTDGSGTTSGTPSTSTQVFAANSARKYLFIQNLDPTNSIWINFTGAATATNGSIQLIANAAFVQEASYISTEVLNVLSTAASVKFTAKQG